MRTTKNIASEFCWNTRTRSLGRRRTGAVLVAVLACILVVIALVGVAMKSTLSARRQCKLELQMQQAEMLLQAGIDRIGAIDSDSALTTVWDARAALPEFAIAEARYERLSSDGTSGRLRCTVRLGISASPDHAIQLSRDIVLSDQSRATSTIP